MRQTHGFLIFCLAIVSLTSWTASANSSAVKTSEYYRSNRLLGEFPNGFLLLDDFAVSTIIDPEKPLPSEECTLKKNMVIHPWAKKTKSEFVTLSPVSRWRATRIIEISTDDNKALKVKAGQEIVQLHYVSEGFCRLEVGGKLGYDTCFGSTVSDDDRAKLLSFSAFPESEFSKVSCAEGGKKWISLKALSDSMTIYEDAPLKRANIQDFGIVEEP